MRLRATLQRCSKRKNSPEIALGSLCRNNAGYLKKTLFRPVLKGFCIRAICFYQEHLSRKMCPYQPSCSEYTKRCINNLGVVRGILLGAWRILRCNPFSKGGIDPAPERYTRRKWLL